MQVGIILLNWNRPYDTIESAESALNVIADEKVVVVVDNNSTDQSAGTIFKHFCERGISILSVDACDLNSPMRTDLPEVVLLMNDTNSGFAGGNNLAIRFLMRHYATDYIWLLNSDAVVEANTLEEMLKLATSNSNIGFVGSIIRYYDKPDTIQCFGGGFIYPTLGMSRLYLKQINISELHTINTKQPDYIMGASLLVRTETVCDIGLMSEDYFMYYEESDWQLRGKRAGWKSAVASRSYVFHKESGYTNASNYYFYYLNRAAILFTKTNYSRFHMLLAAISLILLACFRGLSHPASFRPTIRGLFDGLKGIRGEKKWL